MRAAWLGMVAVAASAGIAHAEEAAPPPGPEAAPAQTDDPTWMQVGKGVVNRTRRAIALGPVLGVGGAVSSEGDLDVPISLGLSVSLFKVPIVPDRAMLEDIVKARVKARLQVRIKELAAGRPTPPSPEELVTIEQQIVADVRAEILGLANPRSQTFEKPRLMLALEGIYHARAESFGARLTGRYGIGPVSIGPTLHLRSFDGNVQTYGGAELAVQALPNKASRANVYELALRADFPFSDGLMETSLVLRALLDVI